MQGRDLGVNHDDMEGMETEQETNQEILENRDVSVTCQLRDMNSLFCRLFEALNTVIPTKQSAAFVNCIITPLKCHRVPLVGYQ